MATFKEIRIVGFDVNRPPRVRKEAYIDLFYRLSEDAPEEWCEDFASFGRHVSPIARVEKGGRGVISTYVNDMEIIPEHLEQLRQAVSDCNRQYLEKITQREIDQAKADALPDEQGSHQSRLNEIVAGIDFTG